MVCFSALAALRMGNVAHSYAAEWRRISAEEVVSDATDDGEVPEDAQGRHDGAACKKARTSALASDSSAERLVASAAASWDCEGSGKVAATPPARSISQHCGIACMLACVCDGVHTCTMFI